MYYSTSETRSEGQSWQVHKFHCCLFVDHSEKGTQQLLLLLSFYFGI